jgi:hypothetical protein
MIEARFFCAQQRNANKSQVTSVPISGNGVAISLNPGKMQELCLDYPEHQQRT